MLMAVPVRESSISSEADYSDEEPFTSSELSIETGHQSESLESAVKGITSAKESFFVHVPTLPGTVGLSKGGQVKPVWPGR